MNDKTQARLRRARKARMSMRTAGAVRLSVHRTPRHIYAQVINGEGDRVLAQASTLIRIFAVTRPATCLQLLRSGKLVAERAKAAGVTEVAFDRSGYKYHGRVKALAEAKADWSFKAWQTIRDRAISALKVTFKKSWFRSTVWLKPSRWPHHEFYCLDRSR